MDSTTSKAIRTKVNGSITGYRGAYCNIISDPIQTHAIYGISKQDKVGLQASLKTRGAKRFRTVNATGKGLVILCFDATGLNFEN